MRASSMGRSMPHGCGEGGEEAGRVRGTRISERRPCVHAFAEAIEDQRQLGPSEMLRRRRRESVESPD